jgi:hypothetical protein
MFDSPEKMGLRKDGDGGSDGDDIIDAKLIDDEEQEQKRAEETKEEQEEEETKEEQEQEDGEEVEFAITSRSRLDSTDSLSPLSALSPLAAPASPDAQVNAQRFVTLHPLLNLIYSDIPYKCA